MPLLRAGGSTGMLHAAALPSRPHQPLHTTPCCDSVYNKPRVKLACGETSDARYNYVLQPHCTHAAERCTCVPHTLSLFPVLVLRWSSSCGSLLCGRGTEPAADWRSSRLFKRAAFDSFKLAQPLPTLTPQRGRQYEHDPPPLALRSSQRSAVHSQSLARTVATAAVAARCLVWRRRACRSLPAPSLTQKQPETAPDGHSDHSAPPATAVPPCCRSCCVLY